MARLEDVPESGLLGVRTSAGEPICLINAGGEIHAVSDRCTHQDYPMSDGMLLPERGCVIECVWHGARFDYTTGAVLKWPAEEPLPVFDVKVEDGVIYVGGRIA